MAKKRVVDDLDSVTEIDDVPAEFSGPGAGPAVDPVPGSAGLTLADGAVFSAEQISRACVDIPILLIDIEDPGYLSRRVDLTLSGEEGHFWQRALISARKLHLTFHGRRPDEHVESSADLLRYLVQKMMESVYSADSSSSE